MCVSTTLRAPARRVLTGLRRCHVAALAGALGARQGRLDDQQVGVARRLDQLLEGRQSAL